MLDTDLLEQGEPEADAAEVVDPAAPEQAGGGLLGEVTAFANRGLEQACVVLSALCGRNFEPSGCQVESVDAASVKADAAGMAPAYAFPLGLEAGRAGPGLPLALLLPEVDACVMADLLVGGDGSGCQPPLSDAHVGLLQEACAQAIEGAWNSAALRAGWKRKLTVGRIAPPSGEAPAGVMAELAAAAEVAFYRLELGVTAGGARFTALCYLPASVAEDLFSSAEEAETAPPGAGAAQAGSTEARPEAAVRAAQFGGLHPAVTDREPGNIDLILDVPLNLTVELGRTRKLIREVLALSRGSVMELDRTAGEPLDLMVNGRLIARGEVVIINENFGIRVTDIVTPAERVKSLS